MHIWTTSIPFSLAVSWNWRVCGCKKLWERKCNHDLHSGRIFMIFLIESAIKRKCWVPQWVQLCNEGNFLLCWCFEIMNSLLNTLKTNFFQCLNIVMLYLDYWQNRPWMNSTQFSITYLKRRHKKPATNVPVMLFTHITHILPSGELCTVCWCLWLRWSKGRFVNSFV